MKTYSIENIRRAAKGEGGFTLIELLVTVTIIGVLAAVVSVGVGGGTANAATKSNQATFNQVQAAVDSYLATSTSNVLTNLNGVANTNEDANYFYGSNGAFTVQGTTSDKVVALSVLTTNNFLRLNANPNLSCIFSTTTSAVKGCK